MTLIILLPLHFETSAIRPLWLYPYIYEVIECPLHASYNEFAWTPMEEPFDGFHVRYE
jgi:hypothetical protein